jgi:hypothetical protein
VPTAGIAAGWATAVFGIATSGNGLALFAIALPDSAGAVVAKPEMRYIELRHGDADKIATFAADHLAVRDVLAKILSDPAADDLSEAALIPLDFHDHGMWNDELPNDE